jgi:hypothetical protein
MIGGAVCFFSPQDIFFKTLPDAAFLLQLPAGVIDHFFLGRKGTVPFEEFFLGVAPQIDLKTSVSLFLFDQADLVLDRTIVLGSKGRRDDDGMRTVLDWQQRDIQVTFRQIADPTGIDDVFDRYETVKVVLYLVRERFFQPVTGRKDKGAGDMEMLGLSFSSVGKQQHFKEGDLVGIRLKMKRFFEIDHDPGGIVVQDRGVIPQGGTKRIHDGDMKGTGVFQTFDIIIDTKGKTVFVVGDLVVILQMKKDSFDGIDDLLRKRNALERDAVTHGDQ